MARLTLGTVTNSFPLWPSHVVLKDKEINTHKHLMGLTETGKTKLLEGMVMQSIRQGLAVSVLDPYTNLVESILRDLIALGFFRRPDAFDRLLYVEFHDNDSYIPYNILDQPHSPPDVIADDVLEAFHRAWPSLSAGSAPQFDTLVTNGIRILIEHGLPLPALYPVILNEEYRERLLEKVDLYGVRAYFDNFNRLRVSEQADQAASTLRRLNLLLASPALEYSLGQSTNPFLNARRIMDRAQSVLYDLGKIQNTQARKLLGSLLMVGYERAAFSRKGTQNLPIHHLIVDEFSEFSAQSSDALSAMLSGTRQFGLFATCAHQTWGQLGERLQGALQNMAVKISLRIGPIDAELMAKWYGRVDPMATKFEPAYEKQNPTTYPLIEQWQLWRDELTNLKNREALVKIRDKPAVCMRTVNVPTYKVDPKEVEAVKAEYRRRLMRHKSRIVLPYRIEEEPIIRRA